jgi:hypothetical protein
MRKPLKYLIYATLCDAYQDYMDSDKIYNEYWGFSENPPMTEEEFHEKKRLELIDRINRVPFDSEKADRGTAFNEIVDCIIAGRNSEKMKIEKVYRQIIYGQTDDCDAGERCADVEQTNEVIALKADYNNRSFVFPISVCREFADYYKGATPQAYTEAVLHTRYGDVQLYGYIDELMPMCIHDIKTTGKYTAGKFKSHWQHIVYPYCLQSEGNNVSDFEYNVLLINERTGGNTYDTFTEHYSYNAERDIPMLTNHVESLIEFIETHKGLISDKKIFNQHEQS